MSREKQMMLERSASNGPECEVDFSILAYLVPTVSMLRRDGGTSPWFIGTGGDDSNFRLVGAPPNSGLYSRWLLLESILGPYCASTPGSSYSVTMHHRRKTAESITCFHGSTLLKLLASCANVTIEDLALIWAPTRNSVRRETRLRLGRH